MLALLQTSIWIPGVTKKLHNRFSGIFVGIQMTGNTTRTNSAQRGHTQAQAQSCKYAAIYILQCCNLIFHVLHFHVIRMINNFVKNLFSQDQP